MSIVRVSFHSRTGDVYCEFFWGRLRSVHAYPAELTQYEFGEWPAGWPIWDEIDFAEGVIGQA